MAYIVVMFINDKRCFQDEPHEARYRQLLANGASAWAGDGFARAKIQQEKHFIGWMPMAIYPLPARRYLNWDVAMVPWQPSIWRKEAGAVSGVDVSETAIRWAEDRFQQAGLDAIFSSATSVIFLNVRMPSLP